MVIKLIFCSDFEVAVQLRYNVESGQYFAAEVIKLNLGQDLVKILKLYGAFCGDADVWLKLKLMLGRDSEDEI